ncbi:MAG: cytochrome c biogenesis protein ResB [Candidatus Alcyoniella australis]|nr:cytochrome c biogenesis protein ResB [Candidatus Alcyoniella australis]
MKVLSSLKLSVWLLLIFTAMCLVGVLIPQRPGMIWVPHGELFEQAAMDYRQTLQAGGDQMPLALAIANYLNPYDVFRSLPFVTLIVLMLVNIIACSIDRLTKLLRSLRAPMLKLDRTAQGAFSNLVEVRLGQTALEGLESRLARHGTLRKLEQDSAVYYAVERGRLGRFGVYMIHLAVLVLAVGAMIGVLYGQRGMINLPEGGSTEFFYDRDSGEPIDLGFKVSCESFKINLYPGTQEVSDYLSHLLIERPGEPPERTMVEVNRPYKAPNGFTLYQNNYGNTTLLQIEDKASGRTYQVSFESEAHGPLAVPDSPLVLVPLSFREDPLYGPRLELALQHPDGFVERALLLFHYPEHDADRPDARTSITPRSVQYTGLEVGYDPGVSVVYLSFVLFMVGLLIVFGVPHRHYYARLEGNKLYLTGRSNKYQDTMAQKLEQLAAELKA